MTEPPASKLRLDQLLVLRGMAPSRERARALIIAGHVSLPGTSSTPKPGQVVRADAEVHLRQADHPYVGRGALKLVHALDMFAGSRPPEPAGPTGTHRTTMTARIPLVGGLVIAALAGVTIWPIERLLHTAAEILSR